MCSDAGCTDTPPKALIDPFMTGPVRAGAVIAASMAILKALIERTSGAEMSHPTGLSAHHADATDHANSLRPSQNAVSAPSPARR